MTVRTFTTGFAASLSTEPSNAVQKVTLTGGPTGGTFTLTLNGHTTTGIAYNATAVAVEAAIAALSGVGVGNIVVAVPASGTYWVVTFQRTLAVAVIPTMSIDPSGLTGGTPSGSVSVVVPGVSSPTNFSSFAALNYTVRVIPQPVPQTLSLGANVRLFGNHAIPPAAGQLWPRGNTGNEDWPTS